MSRLSLNQIDVALIARIVDAYREEVTIEQICGRFNLAPNTLKEILRREQIPARAKPSLYLRPSKRVVITRVR